MAIHKSDTKMDLTIHRRLLNEKLEEVFEQNYSLGFGKALDVGAGHNPYRKFFRGEYFTLEKNKELNSHYCCDASEMTVENNSFDVVLATELLEHMESPQKAVKEIHRVLRKTGVCIASVPFLYRVHEDEDSLDYWRFTPHGLSLLFKDFPEVRVIGFGSTSTTILNIIFNSFPFLNRFSGFFYKLRIGELKSGYIVVARKATISLNSSSSLILS